MNRLEDALVDQWLYDIEMLSQGWVLWTVFPALVYAAFMMIKWLVLTCPIWLPICVLAKVIRPDVIQRTKD